MPAAPVPRGFLTGTPPTSLAVPRGMVDNGPGTAINSYLAQPAAPAYKPTQGILTEQTAKEAADAYKNKQFNSWYAGLSRDDAQQFAKGNSIDLNSARSHFVNNVLPNDSVHRELTNAAALATRARTAMVPVSVQAQRDASTAQSQKTQANASPPYSSFNGPTLPPIGQTVGLSTYARAMSKVDVPPPAPVDAKTKIQQDALALKQKQQEDTSALAREKLKSANDATTAKFKAQQDIARERLNKPAAPTKTPAAKPVKVGYESPAYREDIGIWKADRLAWKKAQGDPQAAREAGPEPARPNPNDDKYHPQLPKEEKELPSPTAEAGPPAPGATPPAPLIQNASSAVTGVGNFQPQAQPLNVTPATRNQPTGAPGSGNLQPTHTTMVNGQPHPLVAGPDGTFTDPTTGNKYAVSNGRLTRVP